MGAIIADRQARFLAKIADAEATMDEMVQRMCGIEGHYEGLPAICKAWDIPYGRVMAWLMADAERYARYGRALAMQAKALIGDTLPLADEAGLSKAELGKAKLQIDTRFRLASFHDKATYGESKGVGGGGVTVVVNRGVGASAVGGPVDVSAEGQTLTVL